VTSSSLTITEQLWVKAEAITEQWGRWPVADAEEING